MLLHHYLLQIIVMFVKFIYITSYFSLCLVYEPSAALIGGQQCSIYCHFVVMSYVKLLEFILEKSNNTLECLGILVKKAMTALKEL